MSVLKDKLGEDGYAELMGLFNNSGSGFKAWLMGSLKSWTVWFGALLVALPEVAPLITPDLKELLTPDQYMRAMQVFGVIAILLRVKTKVSLKDKA